MGGKRFGRGEGKGGQEASRSADSAATKPAATDTAGGPAAGTSASSDPRRVDPLREGVNAWFKATAVYVQLHDKLVSPLDQELVNMHDGVFWLGEPVADPNLPGAMIPPPPFEMNEANRHRSLPFYSETAPTAPAAAVAAHKNALTWVRAFHAIRRALPGNVDVEGRRVGADGATLVTSPALADYAAERLSNMEEVINILNAVYPGAERKLLRTSAMARLAELNKWAAAMLKAMPKVLKTDCGVQAEYEAVMQSGNTGTDPQFQRRGAAGLELYKLNYVASLAMARAPGAQQAAANRSKDWVNITRTKSQSQHDWRAKLTELGQQQQPPLTPEDREWKLRFITGSSLGAATPDPFRAYKWRASAATIDQLLATSATDLTTILGDLLAANGSAAPQSKTDGSSDRRSMDGQGKPASNKGQHSKSNAGGAAADKPAFVFSGTCWNCNKEGHKGVDCPTKKNAGKPSAPGQGKAGLKRSPESWRSNRTTADSWRRRCGSAARASSYRPSPCWTRARNRTSSTRRSWTPRGRTSHGGRSQERSDSKAWAATSRTRGHEAGCPSAATNKARSSRCSWRSRSSRTLARPCYSAVARLSNCTAAST
jgi:hypothetical protein